LRELIGEETLTYVGLSYGTVIGQVYANMFPHRVRAMMLDGVVDVVADTGSAEARTLVGTAAGDEVFNQFLTLCDAAGPQRCALTGDGQTAAERYGALRDRVRRDGPLSAPKADPPGQLFYSDLLVSSFAPLRDPNLWPDYAKQLRAAADGDISSVATSAQLWRSPGSWQEAVKSSAISCLDGPATKPVSDWRSVIADFTENSQISGPVLGWWLWAPCASNWPARDAHRYAGPWDARTEVPILLIGTRYDPNTAYQNAVRAQKLLGNAVLLTHDGYGHLSMKDESRCVEAARVRYLVDLQPPAPGTVCPADKKPFT
jgi:pimeloyl-ACP methyl ester carboxylesterase